MNKVYVLGGAQTDFERNWSREGKNPVAMLREVLSDGCKDAGISYDDIAALGASGRVSAFVGSYLSELYNNQSNVGALLTEVNPAFAGVPSVRVEAASASGAAAIDAAVSKIKAGDADVAVVVGWTIVSTVKPDVAAGFNTRSTYVEKEAMGESVPNAFGQLTDVYLEKNGDEDRVMRALARLTELSYENAKRSPYALTRKLFMNEKQANLRGSATNALVADRLAMSDVAAVTDGAAVVILVSEDYKAKLGRALPVIKGRAARTAPLTLAAKLKDARANEHLLPWARKAAEEAYQSAGLTADDMGVFELHDCHTTAALLALSSAGLCKPGEEVDLIERGEITASGRMPVNPTGGLLGGGNAQSANGVRMLLSLSKQVAGTAGACQVDGVKNGLMLALGSGATANFAFVVGAE